MKTFKAAEISSLLLLCAQVSDLDKAIRTKENENEELDRVLEELVIGVSERHNIHQVNGWLSTLLLNISNFTL